MAQKTSSFFIACTKPGKCMCVRAINFAYVFTIFYDSVIEVTVLSQESERHVCVLGASCMCVKCIDFAFFFTFLFLSDSGNVLIVWYFFLFHSYYIYLLQFQW